MSKRDQTLKNIEAAALELLKPCMDDYAGEVWNLIWADVEIDVSVLMTSIRTVSPRATSLWLLAGRFSPAWVAKFDRPPTERNILCKGGPLSS